MVLNARQLIGSVTVAGLVLATPFLAWAGDVTWIRREDYHRIVAEEFAPVWLQEITESHEQEPEPGVAGSPLPLQDQFVRIDAFQGRWNIAGNYEAIESSLRKHAWIADLDLTPTVYYAVVESEHFAFVYYAYYHLRDGDSARIGLPFVLKEKRHEHDLEGALLVLSKGPGLPPSGWGILGVYVQRHDTFEVRSAEGKEQLLGYRSFPPFEALGGRLSPIRSDATGHVLLGSQAGDRISECPPNRSGAKLVRESQKQFCDKSPVHDGHGTVFADGLDGGSVALVPEARLPQFGIAGWLSQTRTVGRQKIETHSLVVGYRLFLLEGIWELRYKAPFQETPRHPMLIRESFDGEPGFHNHRAHPPWMWKGSDDGPYGTEASSWLSGSRGDWFLDVLGEASGIEGNRCLRGKGVPWICALNRQLPRELAVSDTTFTCNPFLDSNGWKLVRFSGSESGPPAPVGRRAACPPGVRIPSAGSIPTDPVATPTPLVSSSPTPVPETETSGKLMGVVPRTSPTQWSPNTEPCPAVLNPWEVKQGDFLERISGCAYKNPRLWRLIQADPVNRRQGRNLDPLNLRIGEKLNVPRQPEG